MNTQVVEKPIGYECKHAVYVEANDGSPHDLLAIKEYRYYADGRREAHLRLTIDYQRPFWITREAFRNHHDKKEWEHVQRLQIFKSTQIGLRTAIGRAFGRGPGNGSMRMLARAGKGMIGQYLYGIDVTTPVLAKHHYLKEWPQHVTDNSVAVLDIETDMTKKKGEPGFEEPIIVSITLENRAKLILVESFAKSMRDPQAEIMACIDKYIGEVWKKRGMTLDLEIVKNPGEAAARAIQTCHEWAPDILAIWNMNFDIPKMNEVLERYGYDLAQVWSDPSVPDVFKYFKYVEGPAQKVTASGKTMALAPAERWHVVHTPAKFYVLDAMCVYLKLRIAKGKDPSYALDAILKKHELGAKLKFEEANHVKGGAWHEFMQRHHKPEYCVYGLYDCIGVNELDEKTTDLKRMISLMCAHSEYHRFPSQPRRTCDDLHFFALERNLVCATTSDRMEDELDQYVVSLQDWIVTLPSYMVHDTGIKLLEELPDHRTLVRAHVADLDVEGTYPNVEIVANISKETTSRELSKIRGVSEQAQRAAGIHLSGGYVNAVEIAVTTMGAPSMDTLLESFQKRLAAEQEIAA